jgi:hypothetical protein
MGKQLVALVLAAAVAAACDGGGPSAPTSCPAAAAPLLVARTVDGRATIAGLHIEGQGEGQERTCAIDSGCVPASPGDSADARTLCAEVRLRWFRPAETCRLTFRSARGALFNVDVAASASATLTPAATSCPQDIPPWTPDPYSNAESSTVVSVDFPDDTSTDDQGAPPSGNEGTGSDSDSSNEGGDSSPDS